MDEDVVVVGIDVSKARLDVHVLPAGEAFAVASDAVGIAALVERLEPLTPSIVAVEATGGLESVVAAQLGAARLPVVVVDPAQVRAFARALGRRAKTDPIDAEVIARFAEAIRPLARDVGAGPPGHPAPADHSDDRGGRAAREAGFQADQEEHPAPRRGAAEGALGHRQGHRRHGSRRDCQDFRVWAAG